MSFPPRRRRGSATSLRKIANKLGIPFKVKKRLGYANTIGSHQSDIARAALGETE